MVSDGEIGTGTRSDSEREGIKGTVTGRSKDRAAEGGDWARRGEPQKPGDRQPVTGGRLSNRARVAMEREIRQGQRQRRRRRERDTGSARGRQTVRNWVRERKTARERVRENLGCGEG